MSMFNDYFNFNYGADADVDKLWPDMAPAAVVLQLDFLFAILALLTLAHACALRGGLKGSTLVLFLAFHTACFEHASLFLGGTHCHATSAVLPMITPCSSVNSVLFYVPWIYTSLEAARRLLATGRIHLLAFPFVVGLLQFGFGVVYEMQGPTNNFWNWPNPDTAIANHGAIAESLKLLGPWENYPGLAALEDAKAQHAVATIDASGLFAVSSHAQMALEERLFGFPVLAPYFHFAYGFAWALPLTLALTLSYGTTTTIPSLTSIVVSGLHSTLLFIIPIELTRNITNAFGMPYRLGVPVSLGLSLLPIVLLKNRKRSETKTKTKKGSSSATAEDADDDTSTNTDPLLFSISFLMHAFMVSFPWRAPTPTPSGLVLLVTTISTLHLAAQFYCCFVVAMPSRQSQSTPW
jgi:hypothetical protein